MNNATANALASQVNNCDNEQLIELVGHFMEQARPVLGLIAALETCLNVLEAPHFDRERPAWIQTCYDTVELAKKAWEGDYD